MDTDDLFSDSYSENYDSGGSQNLRTMKVGRRICSDRGCQFLGERFESVLMSQCKRGTFVFQGLVSRTHVYRILYRIWL